MRHLFFLLMGFTFQQGYAQLCDQPNAIVSMRTRKAGNTEYVIFTIRQTMSATWAVASANPPFSQDGSGAPIAVLGCRFKLATFKNIVWTCNTKVLLGNTILIQAVKNTGQFEEIVSYAIGYRCTAKSVVSYDYEDGDYRKIVIRLRR